MRVAAARYPQDCIKPTALMARWVRAAILAECDILLAPGLYGALWEEDYMKEMRRLSRFCERLLICPGSYYERTRQGYYHTSCLLYRGENALIQRQLYLNSYERQRSLLRGNNVQVARFQSATVGILLPTDAYYPGVARAFALQGADLLLCPTALPASQPMALIETHWSSAQQNALYALSSPMRGEVAGTVYDGDPALLAPMRITPGGRGYGAQISYANDLSVFELDFDALRKERTEHNPLSTLNRKICTLSCATEKEEVTA